MELKTERLIQLRELIVTQLNHWALFPLYLTMTLIFADIYQAGKPQPFLWAVMGLIPILFYIARRYLTKFIFLCLSHAFVFCALFLLPAEHISLKLLYMLFGACYVISSFYLWAKTSHRQDTPLYPVIILGICVASFLLQHQQGHTEWDNGYFVSLIFVMGLYFIAYFMDRYLNFLTMNSSSAAHIPAGDIFKSGIGLVLGYTAIGMVILFLVTFSSNFSTPTFHLKPMEVPPSTTSAMPDTMAMAEEIVNKDDLMALEPWWGWDVIFTILQYLVLALIMFVAVKLLFSLMHFIRQKMQERPVLKVYAKADVSDLHEKCEIVKDKNWRAKIPFLPKNPTERVRWLYKKQVLSEKSSFPDASKQRNVLNRYTARESSRILKRDQLANIYEKARYSNTSCEKEDVKLMQEACKK